MEDTSPLTNANMPTASTPRHRSGAMSPACSRTVCSSRSARGSLAKHALAVASDAAVRGSSHDVGSKSVTATRAVAATWVAIR